MLFCMRVVLAVEELNEIYGGVERTVASLTNHLHATSCDVTILTFEAPESGRPAYDIHPAVSRKDLGLLPPDARERATRRTRAKSRLPGPVTAAVRNALALRRIRSSQKREIPLLARTLAELRPDVVISFKTHFHRYVVPAANQARVPAIASDHNPPEVLYYDYVSSVDRRVILKVLEGAAAIRTLQSGFAAGYPESLRPKCVAIPNGIELPEQSADVLGRGDSKIILNVGRLYFQKDQATLIRAFATLADSFPEWIVEIYGDGDQEELLGALIAERQLQERVFLRGATRDIMRAYQNAQIFALPSLFEGFGNVTLEALACGLPVVAFDDVLATRELVTNDYNGILVGTDDRVAAFATGLKQLMSDPELRVSLGQRARESAQRFDTPIVMKEWEALIERVRM